MNERQSLGYGKSDAATTLGRIPVAWPSLNERQILPSERPEVDWRLSTTLRHSATMNATTVPKS